MATRRAVTQQKQILKAELKAGVREGLYPPGDPAPSVRELAQRYQLSRTVVAQALQDLIEDGVLHSVPRVGTFFGRPESHSTGFYLLLLPYPVIANPQFMAVQSGFEEVVAAHGGSSLVMTQEAEQAHENGGTMPPLSGVLEMLESVGGKPRWTPRLPDHIPCVRFAHCQEANPSTDTVGFDNEAGGMVAAQHLLKQGFRSIAFLGLYSKGATEEFRYSAEREAGWRKAMTMAGLEAEGLAFVPPGEFSFLHPAQVAAARDAAWPLVRRPEIQAVIAASSLAAQGLFEALLLAEVPAAKWPTVVAFDDFSFGGECVVSTIRLPWEEIGRQAAELLWQRSHEQRPTTPRHILVPMKLIQRLTCRINWAATGRGPSLVGMTAGSGEFDMAQPLVERPVAAVH